MKRAFVPMGKGTIDMLKIILTVVQILLAVFLTAVVLLQEGKTAGLSGAISGVAESYFGKNKARTMEGKLERITKILAVAYIIIALILYFVIA